MGTNNSDVSTALGFIDRVETNRRELLALYDEQNRGPYSDAIGRKVADKHQTIGYGMKMADLLLMVSIAKSLEVLSGRVTP